MTAPASPKANCTDCSNTARAVKHTTFSYWYCDNCKDEVDVWLKLTNHPKGEYNAFSSSPVSSHELLTINNAGTYRLSYNDGTFEFYELTEFQATKGVKLNRNLIKSAERLTERDLPSRKRLQSTAETGVGTTDGGLCLRDVSNKANSLQGNSEELEVVTDYAKSWPWYKKPFIYKDSFNNYKQVDIAGNITSVSEDQVWKLAPSHFSI